ncbi:MAG: dihydropteroate synthase [Alicyclobacillaceae bacterium]|nr:dihydropteroate synthase [Alicyclobacillaceae bacterium]
MQTLAEESGAPTGSTPARTLVMGIVNVTPDSFSDGGRFLLPEDALRHAWQLVEDGADIIDLGAESTRPGATPLPAEEEWRRLCPVLEVLGRECPVPVSVDTYKADIAERALALGARMINDVWGGLADPRMLSVVARAGCEYVWMHNRPEPAATDAFAVLVAETQAGINRCLEAGIQPDKLWIDPGIGFGKTYEQNLVVLKRLSEYTQLGYPVLLGTSRKSVIGRTLGVGVDGRLAGSLATVAWGVQAGVRAVRVHDVRDTVMTCRMVEAIVHAAG